MDQPRNRHVPNTKRDNTLQVCGLRWHGPDPRPSGAGAPVVGAPSRSDGYGVVAPRPTPSARVPLWGRGIPGTRALARVAARCTSSATC